MIENIIENILNNANEYTNILLINNNTNVLKNNSFIIKKKNINILMILEDNLIYNNIKNSIIGEDCEKNITLYNNFNINNNNYNTIVIFNIKSVDNFNNILNFINNNTNTNKYTDIYIYIKLSNEDEKNIIYKNNIKNYINKYLNYNIGFLLSMYEFITIVKQRNFNIENIKIYNKYNYIIYGYDNLYEIILKKNILK